MKEFNLALTGDKSITHRAFILAALAQGESVIENVGDGADLASTREVLRQLGVEIKALSTHSWQVSGRGGIEGFTVPNQALNCGNSGTTMRLLAGLLSGLKQRVTLDGDQSLRQRPMRRLERILKPLGRGIQCQSHGGAPIEVGGDLNNVLDPTQTAPSDSVLIHTASSSAQLKTAALFAGFSDSRMIEVTEISPSRDHSERMLGALLALESGLKLPASKAQFPSFNLVSPGDLSSAGFWIAISALSPFYAPVIKLEGVSLNPSRMGLIRIAGEMGLEIEIEHQELRLGEPVGSIRLRPLKTGATLKAITLSPQAVVDALDELPIVALLAAFAHGESHIRHARELRVKECDRIEAMADNLTKLGVQLSVFEDGWHIVGQPDRTLGSIFSDDSESLHEIELDSYGDHRIAMCLLIAELRKSKCMNFNIKDVESLQVSYPGFPHELKAYQQATDQAR